jgi:hypothetical protein
VVVVKTEDRRFGGQFHRCAKGGGLIHAMKFQLPM